MLKFAFLGVYTYTPYQHYSRGRIVVGHAAGDGVRDVGGGRVVVVRAFVVGLSAAGTFMEGAFVVGAFMVGALMSWVSITRVLRERALRVMALVRWWGTSTALGAYLLLLLVLLILLWPCSWPGSGLLWHPNGPDSQ